MSFLDYGKQRFLLLHDLKKSEIYDGLKNNRTIIAGGAIRAVFGNENISDYDLYFRSAENLFNVQSMLAGEEFVMNYKSNNAYSFSKNGLKIQLIRLPEMICDSPEQVINQFDYIVCMGAFDTENDRFILHEKFIEHIARKELVFNINAKYPIASLYRLNKYFRKGYHISGTEMVKLALSINNLRMEDYSDLKQQLMGIDTLFLAELTDKLMKPDYAEKKYDFNEFIEMLNEYYGKHLEEILE